MVALYFFLSVDSLLGRIDKHSLSQQTLMELLVEHISNRERVCGSKENFKDIAEWKEVKLHDGEVTTIFWYAQKLKGPIELTWLPPSSKKVYLSVNFLSGTVDLTCLPDVLEVLNIGINWFEGRINLTMLPPRLDKLFLHNNAFRGYTDFSQLPKALTHLDVSETQLEGEVWDFEGGLIISGSNVTDNRM